jgi:hypothetical protein
MDLQNILDEFAKSKFAAIGSEQGLAKAKTVYQYDLSGNMVGKYTMAEIRRKFSSGKSDIRKCLKGKRSQAKNHIWKYE